MSTSLLRRLAVVALAVGLAACGGEGAEEGPAGWAGRYQAQGPGGASELTLEERGDTVVLRVEGGEAVGRRAAGGRVEGEFTEAEGTLRFVLERRGAQVAARFTFVGADGQAHEAPELLFSRVEAGGGAGAASDGGARPAALLGHWRHTETFARDGISWATDTHLVLDADGSCRTWSRTEGNVSGSDPETRGRWKAEGDQLLLQPEGSGAWRPAGRFVADGERLMVTLPNGDKQVFERL